MDNQNIKTDFSIHEDEKSILSIIIKNITGSLTKITSYCAQNSMNIERLVLSNFKLDNMEQRVILYITGDRNRINDLLDGLRKIDDVISVDNFMANSYFERELVIIKSEENNPNLDEIMSLTNDFNGKTVLFKNGFVIMEFINSEEKTNELMKIIEDMNTDVELIKSGLIATSLDKKSIK